MHRTMNLPRGEVDDGGLGANVTVRQTSGRRSAWETNVVESHPCPQRPPAVIAALLINVRIYRMISIRKKHILDCSSVIGRAVTLGSVVLQKITVSNLLGT